ncbi:MAG: alpha-galactosidase [Gemmatimonadota bacterium]|nr:alpha-galactosidase [Gemmatimonadota bacterium]
MKLDIALVGAGSREFGPATVSDILLSDLLCERDLRLTLMDVDAAALDPTRDFAEACARSLGRDLRIRTTASLEEGLEDADYVILSIERRRYFYWSQDFHIPRKLGFDQPYGENGGPGGLFHALRGMGPCTEVARTMERVCPDAWLLNYTNPLTKLCEQLGRASDVKTVGLCHGVFGGMEQVGAFLERPVGSIAFEACGLNHFTWFTAIRDRETEEDLYPELRERERRAHWLSAWDEIALSRTLFRTFGLYPSPGANHIAEYIGWAKGFLASSPLQFFYDPAEVDPWREDRIPPWIYNLEEHPGDVALDHPVGEGRLRPSERSAADPAAPKPSGELAIPLIEGLSCGAERWLDAVDVPNRSYIAGLPEGAVVEVPAVAGEEGFAPVETRPLPEGILALLRPQISINRLLCEAFEEGSRDKLLQALLLDPTTPSYRNAVHLIDEMFELQADVLPPLEWSARHAG